MVGNEKAGGASRRTVLASALTGGAAMTLAATSASPANAAGEEAQRGSQGHVHPGADVAAAAGWSMLKGTKLGVFSNPTGVLKDTRHIVDDMAVADGLNIVGIFGPEHGFRGSAQAGGSEGDTVDPRTQLPVYDAYGANRDKLQRLFTKAGVETMVFDIQDVGARFYTYMWALYDSMAVCARLGIKYVVLDRPNPVGGRADGGMMTPEWTSGVGKREVCQQHGMTMGELARFYNGEFLPKDADPGKAVDLTVIKCKGWRPDSRAHESGLPWIPPSPNMPTPDTALVYSGTCMFEGTNLSEGRGTTRPFELIGAPYLDYHWSDRLNAYGLPGVEFREAYFVPTFNKYVNEVCAGVQVHLTDVWDYEPVPTAVAMLVEAKKYDKFAWRYDTYDPARPYWIDKLSGSQRLRTMIDAGATTDEVIGAWKAELKAFDKQRKPYLLYPGRRG